MCGRIISTSNSVNTNEEHFLLLKKRECTTLDTYWTHSENCGCTTVGYNLSYMNEWVDMLEEGKA